MSIIHCALAGVSVLATSIALSAAPAHAAQTAGPSEQLPSGEAADTIVVTGFRESIRDARDSKRAATIIQDVILAEDIAAFPDLNLAEALQRLPGVAINREAGEGRRVSLRGLGPDFTRVQLNGMEVLGNVDSPQDSRGQTTRDRAFDFNIFAAELFNRVEVRKTYSAEQTEGGLAGTVGLYTAKPFDYKGFELGLSAQAGTNTATQDFQPRIAGLISQNWGDFGILISGAYNRRKTEEQGYNTYRWRPLNASGSDVSSLTPEQRAAIASGEVLFARGNRLSVWQSDQERLGLTGAVQWAPSDAVKLTFDALYGHFSADRDEFHLASRGNAQTLLAGGATVNGVTFPNSKINDIRINDNNEAVYLDVSSANLTTETRRQRPENTFQEYVLSGEFALTERLILTALGGIERSSYDMPISDKFYLEAFGDIVTEYTGTFDARNTYGFDTADPSQWRAHEIDFAQSLQESEFDTVRGDLAYEISGADTLRFGGEWRRFANSGYSQRADNILLPEFQSGAVDDDVTAYAKTLAVYDNQDWTIVDFDAALDHLGVTRSVGSPEGMFSVEEETFAVFAQYEWDRMLGDVPFRGNLGLRYYTTDITSVGEANVGMIRVQDSYEGWLPTANLVFELAPDLLLRAAASKNINRPSLGALAVNGTISEEGGEITVNTGNPGLSPYTSWNGDIAAEYYFGEIGYVAVGLFYKHIDGFIGTDIATNVPYSQTGLPTNLLNGITSDTIVAFYSRPVNNERTNLFGVEASFQSDFTFLPAPFDRFGTILNITYVASELDYATPAERKQGISYLSKLDGLSDVTANATLYYEGDRFSSRISADYRSDYIRVARPIGNEQDSDGFDATIYLDFAASYNFNDSVQFTFDAINLTNEREQQWSDSARRLYNVTQSGTTLLAGVRFTY